MGVTKLIIKYFSYQLQNPQNILDRCIDCPLQRSLNPDQNETNYYDNEICGQSLYLTRKKYSPQTFVLIPKNAVGECFGQIAT